MQFIRLKEVMNRTALSRSTIYGLIARDQFPSQRRLSVRAVGWDVAEIEEWLGARQHVREQSPRADGTRPWKFSESGTGAAHWRRAHATTEHS